MPTTKTDEDRKAELLADFQRMQFAVERSKRYHAARATQRYSFAMALQALELYVSTTFVSRWISPFPAARRVIVAAAFLATGLALIHQFLKAQAAHMEKKGAFSEIAKLFPVDLEKGDEELFVRIRNAREDVEKTDGSICECLDIRCHNDECLSRGWADQCHPLSWLQRNVLVYFPVRYTEPKKATSSASEAATPAGGRLSSIAALALAGALGVIEALSCPSF